MASRAFYLNQAKSNFDIAAMARDPAMRARWIERANEYLILADALGDDRVPELSVTAPVRPNDDEGTQ